MQPEARSTHVDSVEAHPVAELLACPPETGILLTSSAQSLDFDSGQVIFRQSSLCQGLYLVVSGQLLRRTERLNTRLVLGNARPGDLLELAAVLGDRHHTYSLIAPMRASLLMLPIEGLQRAFKSYPPLRMKLLEELGARGVAGLSSLPCLEDDARAAAHDTSTYLTNIACARLRTALPIELSRFVCELDHTNKSRVRI